MGVATGTFQYTNGSPVANGLWQFKLSQDSILVDATAVCVAPRLISGNLDTLGAMTATFAFNDVLSTAAGLNTCYQLTIKDLGGGQVWNECYILTGTSANINLIPPAGRSGCTGIPITVTSGAGTLTGSGTAMTLAIWTAPTALGNSLATDDGTNLTYAGTKVIIDGGEISTPDAVSGPADLSLLAGNATGAGSSKAANVVLDPGVQSTPSLANNGRVSVRPLCAFYFGNVAFSQLTAPRGNPSSSIGAIVFCTDAVGPEDGATWGSVATTSGNGALLRWTNTPSPNWLVIG